MRLSASVKWVFCAIIASSVVSAVPSYALHADPVGQVAECDEDRLTVAVTGCAGTLGGSAREIVFDDGAKLSELLWDLSGLRAGGLSASVNIKDWFVVNLGYWTILNEGSGDMDDYDWLMGTFAWSDWSHSSVDVKTGTAFDINVSRDFLRKGLWAMDARLGFKKDKWEWNDFNGTYIYSSDAGFRDLTGTFPDETGITYAQEMTIPYIGAGVRGRFDDMDMFPLRVSAYALYSNQVGMTDRDHHIYTETIFEADIEKAEYIAFGAGLSYAFTDHFLANGRVDYQHIPEAIGNMMIYDESTGQSRLTIDSAGIEHEATMYSIGGTWVF